MRLRSAALTLAQYLNCVAEGTGARPCGRCRHCAEIEQGVFADLICGSPARKLAEVREVLGRLAQRPYVGRCRVAVLSDAGDMTREAHNALLKTMEDPPPAAALVLLAPGVDFLPATVVSRCRHIPVGGATWREVARTLEAEGVSPSRAPFAALWSGEDLALARILAARGDLEEIRAQAAGFVEATIGPRPDPPLELVERHQARLSQADEAGLWLGAVGVALWGVIAAGRSGEDFVASVFTAPEWHILGTLDPAAAADMAGRISQAAGAISRHAQARLSLEAVLLSGAGGAVAASGPWPH